MKPTHRYKGNALQHTAHWYQSAHLIKLHSYGNATEPQNEKVVALEGGCGSGRQKRFSTYGATTRQRAISVGRLALASKTLW